MKDLEIKYEITSPQKIVDSLRENNKALAIMATPLGNIKTAGRVISQFFIGKGAYRVLYLCDRIEFLKRAELELSDLLTSESMDVAKMYESTEEISDALKSITFGSLQSFSTGTNWQKRYMQGYFDLVIVDRADMTIGNTFLPVLKYFAERDIPIFGMTTRPDFKHDLFGKPTANIRLEEGIAMGWLPGFEYRIMNDNLEDNFEAIIDQEVSSGRRPTLKSLNETLFIDRRDEEIATSIKKNTLTAKKVIIFCKTVKHGMNFHELLGTAGSRVHYAELRPEMKRNNLEAFKNGNIRYLLVVDLIHQLSDLPEIDTVVFLRGTDSKRIFYDQLTAGLQKTRQNEKVCVLDFVTNLDRLMMIKAKMVRSKILQEIMIFDSIIKSPNFQGEFEKDERYSKSFFKGKNVSLSEVAKRISDDEEFDFSLKKQRKSYFPGIFSVKGNGFDFVFSTQVMKAVDIAERIRLGYYPTYQEAKDAAFSLGLQGKSKSDYRKTYTKDLRLPRYPEKQYPEFINYHVFLETPLAPFYLLSKEEQKSMIGEILEKNRIDSFQSLVEFGVIPFDRADFGIFGNGRGLASVILEKEIGQIGTLVLVEIAEKLGWRKKAESQRIFIEMNN